MTASVRVHGKLILLGEHSVVYGEPAVAVPCAPGVVVSDGAAGRVAIPALGIDCGWTDEHPTVRDLASILTARVSLGQRGIIVTGDLLPGVGLGYSAALSLAVCRWFSVAGCFSETEAFQLAQEAEDRFHGGASGIDLTTCAADGPLRFQRLEQGDAIKVTVAPLQVQKPGAIEMLVAVFPVEQTTRELVAGVRRMTQQQSAFAWLAIHRSGAAARAGEAALVAGDPIAFGRCCNEAQEALECLGVSNAVNNAAVRAARNAGALGAKLSGAGGGGAVLAVVQSKCHSAVQRALAKLHPLLLFRQRV